MKYKRITVEWLDACSTDEWTEIKDVDGTPKKVYTSGWLVKEDKDYLSVAGTISDDGDCACIMHIPRKMIRRVR